MYWKFLFSKIKAKLEYAARRSRSSKRYFEELEKYACFFPKFISVAFTNICNSDCVFCAYKYRKFKPAIIDDALLERIAGEYSAIGGGMMGNSAGLGDPLADPYFWRHLEIVRKYKNITTPVAVTNLIGAKLLGPKRLALEGPTQFWVSIGGFDRATYKRVFKVDCYEDVMESLFTILETRKAAGMPMDVSVICRSDVYWRKQFSSPEYKRLLRYLDVAHIAFQSKNFDNWAGLIRQKDLLPGMTLRKNTMNKKFPCIQLYDNLGILPDGTAVACGCREANADSVLVVGNVARDPLIDLGKSMAKIRREWLAGSIPPICRACSAYYSTFLSSGSDKIVDVLRERHEFITTKHVPGDLPETGLKMRARL